MSGAAVFLDKDGTLVENVPYSADPDRINMTPGSRVGLQRLQAAGYRLFIITNQSGVARGYFPEEALAPVYAYLHNLLAGWGIALDGFYYCPHHPDGVVPEYAVSCECRKPSPGLFFRAAEEHNIDLERSWYIGDILHDVEAGRRAGCRTILVENGGETEWVLSRDRLPHHIVSDLDQAARVILALDRPFDSPAHQLETLSGEMVRGVYGRSSVSLD